MIISRDVVREAVRVALDQVKADRTTTPIKFGPPLESVLIEYEYTAYITSMNVDKTLFRVDTFLQNQGEPIYEQEAQFFDVDVATDAVVLDAMAAIEIVDNRDARNELEAL